MKFDVVLGNPPYQQPNTKTHKLWIRFLQISKDLSNQYILMITPSLIWKPSSKLEKLKEDIQYNTSYLKFGVESHFPSQHTRFKNVQEDICYYLIDLKSNSDHICIQDDIKYDHDLNFPIYRSTEEMVKHSIISKVSKSNYNYLELKSDYKNNDVEGTVKKLIASNAISHHKSKEYPHEFIHSYKQRFFSKEPSNLKGKYKLIFNYSGAYTNMFITQGVIGKQVECLLFESIEDAERVMKIMQSKLFVFYIKNERLGGFNTGIFKIPHIDLSRSWTDHELYNLFKLDKTEIELIEHGYI